MNFCTSKNNMVNENNSKIKTIMEAIQMVTMAAMSGMVSGEGIDPSDRGCSHFFQQIDGSNC